MNIYYKVYLKQADNTESLFYILYIRKKSANTYSLNGIDGKVLKIVSLCTADAIDTKINETYYFGARFCSIVEDKVLIHELDKLAIFQ